MRSTLSAKQGATVRVACRPRWNTTAHSRNGRSFAGIGAHFQGCARFDDLSDKGCHVRPSERASLFHQGCAPLMAEHQPQLRQLQGQQQYPAQGVGGSGGPSGFGGVAASATNRQLHGGQRKSAPAAAYRNQVRVVQAAQECPPSQGLAHQPGAAFPWQRQQQQQAVVSGGMVAAPPDQGRLASSRAEFDIQNAPQPASHYQRQQQCVSQAKAQTGQAAHQRQAILQAAPVQQPASQAALAAAQMQPTFQLDVRHTRASGGTSVPATGHRSGPAALQRCSSGSLLPPQSSYQQSPAATLSQRRHSGPFSAGYKSTPPALLAQRSSALHFPQPEHSGAHCSLRQIMMSARKPQRKDAQQSQRVEASLQQQRPETQQQQQLAPVSRPVQQAENHTRHQLSGMDANHLFGPQDLNRQGAHQRPQPRRTQHMPPLQTIPAVPAEPELGGWQCQAMDMDDVRPPPAAAAVAAPQPALMAPPRQEVWQKQQLPSKLSEAPGLAGQLGDVPFPNQPGSSAFHGHEPGMQMQHLEAQPVAQAGQPPVGFGKQPLRQLLSEWGLPPGVVQAFADKGVKKMYPWQAGALECGEDGSNLVYCAPTSGGKSLVAEVLLVRQLCRTMMLVGRRRRKPRYGRALVVLPYISIVNEKTEHLSQVLHPMQATVKGYFGSDESGSPLAPRGETVAVCTMEKANVAINKLAQEDRLGELCCVVVDELHMVGDGHRGAGLELALSKLLFSPHADHIQIVGMSATMGGLEAMRAWLRARLFLTNYRPVPLTEHAVFQGTVYEKLPGHKNSSTLQPAAAAAAAAGTSDGGDTAEAGLEEDWPLEKVRDLPSSASRDRDCLVPLIAEVTAEGHSVLVFCATRKSCETCADMVAELLPHVAPRDPVLEAKLVEQRQVLLADMREGLGGAVTAELERCFLQGVAFHHAGLTAEERSGVEKGYRSGCLQVLTATSTLAAGINLPARRVILRSLQQGIGPVARSQYLQMVGRAGRAGQSAVGESFIIGQGPEGGREWKAICGLLTEPMPTLKSQLLPEAALEVIDPATGLSEELTQSLQRLLLEAVANGTVASAQDIQRLLQCTLAGHQLPYQLMHAAAKVALLALSTRGGGKGLLEANKDTQLWSITHKGRAVYDSSLPLELAMQLYDDLKKAEEGVVLGSSLHLLYYCMLDHPGFLIANWGSWYDALERLPTKHRRVAEAVGVSSQLAQLARMGRRLDAETAARHARFAASLAVNDLMSERSVTEVVAKWGQPKFVSAGGLSRGQLQKLQLDVSKYMGMAALLCETAGWWPLATLYTNMSQVAAAGVRQELLDLMRVPNMNAGRARGLFRAGIRDAQSLAVADQAAVEKALAGCISAQMKSRGSGAGGGKQQGPSFAPAAMLRRAAEALMQSAREHVVKSTTALTDLVEELQDEERGESSRPSSREDAQEPSVPDGHQHHQQPVLPQKLLAGYAGQPMQGQQQQPVGSHPVGRVAPPTLAGTSAAGTAQHEAPGALTPADLADIRREVQNAPPTPGHGKRQQQVVSIAPEAQQTWTKGLARVDHIQHSTPSSQVEEFLAQWVSQPRFALALYTRPAGCGKPGQIQALAVCWQSDSVAFLDLSPGHCARRLEEGGPTLLEQVGAILGRAGPHKLCFDGGKALPLLLQAGLPLSGPLEDPRVASWLLSPDDLEHVTLKSLQATYAAKFQVRVPSLSKAGLTSTCRTALLTLAVMDPLKRLLAARGMLEAFSFLEMPAALAAGHISAVAASCLLPAAALDQAQSAAQATIQDAAGRLQAIYGSSLDLNHPDAMSTLLGAMRLPQPPRPKRGRPVVTLHHLQLLLKRQKQGHTIELEVLQCLVQNKLCQEALWGPLALMQGSDPSSSSMHEAGSASASATAAGQGARASAGPSAAAAAEPAPVLRLGTLTASGLPDWGQAQDAALGVLLGCHWAPLRSAVSMHSVQEELENDVIQPASLPGQPMAVWSTAEQLRPRLSGTGLSGSSSPGAQLGATGAAAGAAAGAVAAPADEGCYYSEGDRTARASPRLLVVGCVVELSGKRLCTALDFQQHDRALMARVRVACLPGGASTSGSSQSAAAGAEPLAFPGLVELHCSCSEMWRIVGPAAQLLGVPSVSDSVLPEAGKLSCGQAVPVQQQEHRQAAQQDLKQQEHGQEQRQQTVVQRRVAPPPDAGPPRTVATYPVHGYLTGAGWLLGGRQAPSSVLVCIQLQHLELLALAMLSRDPALLEAAGRATLTGAASLLPTGGLGDQSSRGTACSVGSPGSPAMIGSAAVSCSAPYRHLSNCWGAAAGQVAAAGSSDGGHLGVLLTAAATRAVVHSLVHGWSHRELGEALGCDKAQAAGLVQSFLVAFPQLAGWWEGTARDAERRGYAATLAGRQRAFAVGSRADALAKGKVHKAMMQFCLGGSVADIAKAALVAVHAAVAAGNPITDVASRPNGPAHPGPSGCPPGGPSGASTFETPGGDAGGACQVVLAWGCNLVVRAAEGKVHALAAAVRQALAGLQVGRQQLHVTANITAGRSLHLFDQHLTL